MNPFSNLGEKATSFFSDNKHLWILVVAALVLFGGGMAIGRYTLPAQTIVTEKVHEVVKDRIVEKVVTQVQIVHVKDTAQEQKIHRVVVEGIDPPGCKSKTTTEDIGISTVVHDNTNTTQVQYVDKIIEKWQDKIVEKEKRVLLQPDWSVYAGVGYDFATIGGIGQHGVPGMQGAVVQAGLDRRVVGPFWLGLFGNTEGVAGVNLRVTW
jgi:hypothetical protein